MKTPTKVINFVGGSGLGKSTTAAMMFAEMKLRGQKVELVREFVKEWAWQGKKVGPLDQHIIYGNQLDRESALYGKVDYIVTDSPLILSHIYSKYYGGGDSFRDVVLNDLQKMKEIGVDHIYVVLKRNKKFVPEGRYETEEQAKEVDDLVVNEIQKAGLKYISLDCPDRQRAELLCDTLGILPREALKDFGDVKRGVD